MKISYGIALAALSYTEAKPKSQAVKDPASVPNIIQQIGKQFKNLKKNPTIRALLKDDMGLLGTGYGCWCYFENDHGSGKGKAVDVVDEFCKTLHDGYSCILIDAADAGLTCIPWEVPYTSAFGGGSPSGLSEEQLKTECDDKNGADTCESWTCRVEGWFVQSYFSYAIAGGTINAAYEHDKGFDPNAQCITTPGTKSADKDCCNEYPHRFPFKTYGGDKACCVNHTYDTTVKTCCPDGKAKAVC